jgi:glycosyltransferase involved in cell wall biosynthesis
MSSVTFCAYDKPDNVGGPVTWLQRLAPQLKSRGFDVRCLFLLHWGDTGPAISSLREAGIECAAVSGLDHTEARIRWILHELNKNPPDVFVPNLVVAAYHASRWIRDAGIATIGVLHSDDGFYRELQSEFIAGPASNRVTAVVSVSDELTDQVARASPPGVKVRRIPYGVSIPERAVAPVRDRFRLAYVGRLAQEQKRIGHVVAALCAAAHQVKQVEAVIYGDGPDRGVVEQLLAREGTGLPVTLAGLVDSDTIQNRLLEADAIVLLSDYEGLPIALLEAMACGCVPIVSDMKSGIPELVEDGVTGLIVHDRGAAFVDAVRRLSTDTDLRRRLSDAAREHIRRNYSSEVSADSWAALIDELSGARRVITSIQIPRKFRLRPVNPALASADMRAPRKTAFSRAYSIARMRLGAIRRMLTP